jgi:hypothetical protein
VQALAPFSFSPSLSALALDYQHFRSSSGTGGSADRKRCAARVWMTTDKPVILWLGLASLVGRGLVERKISNERTTSCHYLILQHLRLYLVRQITFCVTSE